MWLQLLRNVLFLNQVFLKTTYFDKVAGAVHQKKFTLEEIANAWLQLPFWN